MGGKSGDSGPQINPQSLINQQAQQNRITQFGPQGNLIFGSIGSDGQFQPRTGGAAAALEESPFQERYRQGREDLSLIAQETAAPRIQNLPLAPIDVTQFPERQFSLNYDQVDDVPRSADFADQINSAERATFERGMGLLNPVFEDQNRRLETKLVNQGLPRGSEAFGSDFEDMRRAQNEQMGKLALDAVAAGRAEDSRLFGQGMSARNAQIQDQLNQASFLNTNRAQAVQENQALRSQELSELGGLLGLQPVQPIQSQSFFGPANVDVMGPYAMANQQAMANRQMANQNRNAMMQGIVGLGSAAMGAFI
jgi:hypothetical protein